MSKDLNLQELLKMSENGAKQIKIDLATLDKIMEQTIKGVPEQDISKVEKIKILTNKAIALAKEGKQIEANEIINEIKNIK